ncbi:MAG: hypothetical protein IKL27_06520 [Oscillospiraceae bacterium]|nr:hypothetical protein [Oscillospiraceae bacterium]
MTNETLILETLQQISENIRSINTRLDGIETRLESIEETLEEHTTALDELIKWADDAQVVVKIPFAQAAPLPEAQ